ncbi:type IV pilus twitching motility protein PilT [bacterium]|nr:type IV pilus twitching motility protein PilT [bacterium]
MVTLSTLLRAMLEHKASDMHITSGSPPSFRVNGRILKAKTTSLMPADTKELCYSVLTDTQRARFEEERQIDFSFGVRDVARFRANVYFQRGAVAGAFRHIPFEVPRLNTLGLPPAVDSLIRKPRGLILITGATGSGKTTTLAAMVDALNETSNLHIITIEDPIEYIHSHRNSLVNQREIGQDAPAFGPALKGALREDPDVVMVGEMRDRETIETALALAETGHLVFSTLHTNSAYQSITRMVQVFPPEAQDQIRMQLSMCLEGIITQSLIERVDKKGRALAYELMLPNASIRNLIRENKLFQIPSAMVVGQDVSGMMTFNQSLIQLVRQGIVAPEEALATTHDPDELIKGLREIRRLAG